jgi:transposase-like protein
MCDAAVIGTLSSTLPWGVLDSGRAGLALIVLSVVEQRLDAVRAVLSGARVSEVAGQVGVSRQTLHTWIGRYLVEGVGGLADRSHRPQGCPHQVATGIAVLVAEMRREHPRWGAKRIRLELLRRPVEGQAVPSMATINRILRRRGLVTPRPSKRPRSSYRRFERSGAMQLWQIDSVGGLWLVNPSTGELREAKVVTGVDDHSRFCVMAKVVERGDRPCGVLPEPVGELLAVIAQHIIGHPEPGQRLSERSGSPRSGVA